MKNLRLIGLLVLLLASCTSIPEIVPACGSDVTGTPHVFVVTAFSTELNAVLDTMQVTETCETAGIQYYIGYITQAPQEIILYMSGIGPEAAHYSTELTLHNFSVETLVFSGISGGIDQSLSIGDTVVPNVWYSLSTGKQISVDTHLMDIAQRLDGASYPERGISAEAFVSDEATVTHIREDFHAAVVDMETYFIASIAFDNQVPFIAIRSVSDLANGEKDRNNYQLAAQASAAYLVKFLGALGTP